MKFGNIVPLLLFIYGQLPSVSSHAIANQRSRRICGGQSGEPRIRHNGSVLRNLDRLARKLDAMNIKTDHIISAYRDLELPSSADAEFTCVSEMIPEVQSVYDVTQEQIVNELMADHQVLIELLKNLNLIQLNGNDPDLFMTETQLSLENLIYDALCSLNKAARGLGVNIPRVINTAARVDTCNIDENLYVRFTRDFALFRQMKVVMRELFVKYHFAAQLYRSE